MTPGPGRRQMVGLVVSDAMLKTRVVRVTRLVRHPVYQRVIRRSKKFKIHDSENLSHVGDEVRIEETRPISKEKHWRLVEILRRGERHEDREAQRISELESLGVQQKKEVKKQPEGVGGSV
ncbi:MAG: 30S ribosomal protein S17 [Candidatus Omnitrophica bacterium]|nr:30S ribosomal protein S17 [Candidatus Omnitrophota bacterium]